MPHDISTSAPAESGVPLTEAFFATLCRLTPAAARDLSLQLSLPARAQLALFCNARLHLRPIGRAIATACTETSLINEAGAAGRTLFAQASAASLAPDRQPAGPGKRIALATTAYGDRPGSRIAFDAAADGNLEEAFS